MVCASLCIWCMIVDISISLFLPTVLLGRHYNLLFLQKGTDVQRDWSLSESGVILAHSPLLNLAEVWFLLREYLLASWLMLGRTCIEPLVPTGKVGWCCQADSSLHSRAGVRVLVPGSCLLWPGAVFLNVGCWHPWWSISDSTGCWVISKNKIHERSDLYTFKFSM